MGHVDRRSSFAMRASQRLVSYCSNNDPSRLAGGPHPPICVVVTIRPMEAP
jgi:hypothetical protein